MSWMVVAVGGEWPMRRDPAYRPPSLGSCDEVRDRISAHLPGIDWTEPNWGKYAGEGFTFEFGVGPEEPVDCVAVYVRGGGGVIADLLRFSVPNGWHLIDGSDGERIDPTSPSADNWHRWMAYRDKIRSATPPDAPLE